MKRAKDKYMINRTKYKDIGSRMPRRRKHPENSHQSWKS